jgi:hypothetical protein
MMCRRLPRYPRTEQPSTYCWNLGWRYPSVSYIEALYYDLLENRTGLHLVSFSSVCFWNVLIGRKFWDILGLWRDSTELLPSKVPGSDQVEGSDWINVLNAQDVFLEDAGDVNLECHQNHRPFLMSRNVTGSEINRGVFIDGGQQGFEFSLLMSSMVVVTQVMRFELVFWAVCNEVGFLSLSSSLHSLREDRIETTFPTAPVFLIVDFLLRKIVCPAVG